MKNTTVWLAAVKSSLECLYRLILLTVMLCLPVEGILLADESSPQNAQAPVSSQVRSKVDQWQRLKAENPEEFENQVRKRKERILQGVNEFRHQSPQKFEMIRQGVIRGRRQRLARLREENPQEFQREMGGRMQKFREWKTQNPEKFRQFSGKHPHVTQKFEQREINRFKLQTERADLGRQYRENPAKPRQSGSPSGFGAGPVVPRQFVAGQQSSIQDRQSSQSQPRRNFGPRRRPDERKDRNFQPRAVGESGGQGRREFRDENRGKYRRQ